MIISNNTDWREYVLLNGESVVAKRCNSHAKINETVVVAVHQCDAIVDFFLGRNEQIGHVINHKPTFILRNDELKPHVLFKYLYRDDVERVIAEIEAEPFYDVFPASRYVPELVSKWTSIKLPGWVYFTMCCSRDFGLVKDFDSFEGNLRRAVGVTDAGIAVYRNSIQTGCSLCSEDRIFYMDSNNINGEALARLSCFSHAIEICQVQRSLRRWVFEVAITKGE